MTEIRLASANAEAVIDTRGGRLAQLTVRGHDLLVPFTDRWTLSGCYPMVPWAGRLDHGRFRFGDRVQTTPTPRPPHALHGVATEVAWEDRGDGTLRIDLGSAWPLGGHAEVHYVLGDSSMRCEIQVTAGTDPMPAVVGFHPCFVRQLEGQPYQLDFAPRFMWERGDDYLPTGAVLEPPPVGPWDDCFGGVHDPPRLSWGDVMAIELRSPTTTWVVCDHFDAVVCVEPQTDTPNAFNLSGGTVLGPGETLRLPLEIVWG